MFDCMQILALLKSLGESVKRSCPFGVWGPLEVATWYASCKQVRRKKKERKKKERKKKERKKKERKKKENLAAHEVI